MTVQQGEVERRIGTADRNGLVFGETAGIRRTRDDVHAREAAKRIGDILVGELPDVLRGDDFGNDVRSALAIERSLNRRADAGDDDVVLVVGPGAFLGRADWPLDL